MERKKGILLGILLLLFAALFAFIVLMQYQFVNSGFAEETNENENTSADTYTTDEEDNSVDQDDSKDEEDISSDQSDSEDGNETDSNEQPTHSTRYVAADQLNVRTGPGSDYDIAGMVFLDDEVEVEDNGDEWVEITAGDITGYVNENYLSEEDEE